MDDLAIRTHHLTRHFASVCAVDDLALAIPRGIVFGFLGPNGSGKTTTIRLLLGLIQPTAGSASVLGFDVAREAAEVRGRTGALLEHTGLYERLSAEANLDYHARIARMRDADRQARVRELLTQIGLWERRREPIRDWSRGMKQKLAVARALLHRPPLVFLDEPTAGLDPVAAAALRDDLAGLARKEGTTVFLTTHNLTEAERLCHRVAVVRNGKLLADGAPEDLRARSAPSTTPVTVVGRGIDARIASAIAARPGVAAASTTADGLAIELTGAADVASIVAALVAAGVAIEEVRRPRATLEDLFLDLVEDRADARASAQTRAESVPC
jgi:ABC-2 type transport system ATP-binding protein